jgi:HSP20 family protein
MNSNQCCGGNSCSETSETQTQTQTAQVSKANYRAVVKLLESSDSYTIIAEMPGVKPEGTDVVLEKNELTIKGEQSFQVPEGYRQVAGETRPITFTRTLVLPEGIDRSGLKATMKDGILTVNVPKSPVIQPAKIAVQPG